MSDDRGSHFIRLISATVFGVIAVLIALDLLLDSRDGVGWLHVILEGSVLVAALIGMVAMLHRDCMQLLAIGTLPLRVGRAHSVRGARARARVGVQEKDAR